MANLRICETYHNLRFSGIRGNPHILSRADAAAGGGIRVTLPNAAHAPNQPRSAWSTSASLLKWAHQVLLFPAVCRQA